MNEKKPVLGADREKAEAWLADFLETRGVDVLFDTDELLDETATNSEFVNYQISQFILNSRESDAELFNRVVDIVKGTMIAAAMFVDMPDTNRFAKARRLTSVSVYLDTTFLLYALNYKLAEQKETADALLDLLRENGASLYVFPQHYAEIKDILRAFRDRDAYDTKRLNLPLERLEAEGYTSIEIDREINSLNESLQALGIVCAPRETKLSLNDLTKEKRALYIDYSALKSHILKKIPKYERSIEMLENDLDAISYVINEREGLLFNKIESCVAIFVTTNSSLVRESNRFLRYDSYRLNISPLMSDVDLTSILWVKYAMKVNDIPRMHLIEAARAAAAPSTTVMKSFFEITTRFVKKGQMTEDEAADIRFSAYARAEIMSECGGDASILNDTSVLAVQKRVKERYAAEAISGEERAKQEAKQATQRASDAERKLLSKQSTVKMEIGNLRKNAKLDAETVAKRSSNATYFALTVLLIALAAFSAWLTFYHGISTNKSIISILVSFLSAISAALLWIPGVKVASRVKNSIYNVIFDKQYDKKLKATQPEIGRLEKLLD